MNFKFNNSVKGFLCGALSYFFFTSFDTATKIAAAHMPVLQMMACELLFAALFMAAWTFIEKGGKAKKELQFHKKHLHLARGMLNGISNILFFTGFLHMPLAEFYVILFLIPIWVAMMAAVFLNEKASSKLIIGIVVSFIGVLIALRPVNGISVWALLVLAGTITNSIALIVLRKMTRTESNFATAVSVCFIMSVVAFVPAVFVFKPIDGMGLLLIVIGGACFGTAQRFMIKSFQLATAPVAASSQFLQLIYGAFMGFVFFADMPSIWIYVGGVMVIGANLYLLHLQQREGA
jgi:drug/metabolite transporter (DMT)-like permease